jgi:polyisoprenoid-binding protein YceI
MATIETQTQAQAQIPAGTWKVDPVHSTIAFQVVDTTELFSTITGRFTDFEGALEVGHDLSTAKAYGVIRPASVTTDHEQRDAHLRSPDFFDVEHNPEFRFESDRIEPAGRERVKVYGRLMMKGPAQELELDGHILGLGRGVQGDERLIFHSNGELAWGPMRVEITADVSATKVEPAS